MLSPTNFTRSANHNISSQTRSLHYTNCGSLLLSAHENGNLHTISTSTGQISKTIKLSNNGIRAMVPTHDPLSFLSSSLHTNFDVNYVSAYDNRYLRKFHGHIKPVTAISMNPTDDTFVTSSEDGTVLLFDLRSAHPTSKLALPGYAGNPVASFDKSGYVFGCMASSGETHEMKMYDPKAADAPFETFTTTNSNISDYIRANNVNDFNTEDINYMINGEWVDLKFSESGNHVLIQNKKGLLILMDAFTGAITGAITQSVKHFKNQRTRANLGMAMARDDIVVFGTETGKVVWVKMTGESVNEVSGHGGTVSALGVNGVFSAVASGCHEYVSVHLPKR